MLDGEIVPYLRGNWQGGGQRSPRLRLVQHLYHQTGTQAEAHQELFLQVHGAQVQLLVCEAVELPLQRRVQPGELFPEGVVVPEVGLEGLLVFPDAGHGVTDGGQTSGVDLL